MVEGQAKLRSRFNPGALARGPVVVGAGRVLKKADLKPHDPRRTFGTRYLQENPGQLIELAELIGHSDLL